MAARPKEVAIPRWAGVLVAYAFVTTFLSFLGWGMYAWAPRTCPSCPTVVAAAPVPGPAPDAAPAPPPDAAPRPALGTAQLRYFLDTVDRDLRVIVADYPATIPAHAKQLTLPRNPDFVTDRDLDDMLDRVAAAPNASDALSRYLAHVRTWLPQWRAIGHYLADGDYLDDDLAHLRVADADLRASFTTFLALSRALRTEVDTTWHAELARLPAETDHGAYLRDWNACRLAADATLDGGDLAATVPACHEALDDLRRRRLGSDYFLGLVERIYQHAAAVRRGSPTADRDNLAQLAIYAATEVQRTAPNLSDAQVEAP